MFIIGSLRKIQIIFFSFFYNKLIQTTSQVNDFQKSHLKNETVFTLTIESSNINMNSFQEDKQDKSEDPIYWYGEEQPAHDNDVMFFGEEHSNETGVVGYLPEYGGRRGMIPRNGLPAKTKYFRQLIGKLKKDPMMVARVINTDDTIITLSVIRIRKDDIEACRKRFESAKTVLKMTESMNLHKKANWHGMFMIPLFQGEEIDDPMEFIMQAMVEPRRLQDIDVNEEHHALIVDVIINAIGMNKTAMLEWTPQLHNHDRGVHVLQEAMEQAALVPVHNKLGVTKLGYHGDKIIATVACPHPRFAEQYLEEVKQRFESAMEKPTLDSGFSVQFTQNKNQPKINIGMIGHVANGKTTLTKRISGINTIRFKSEKERNITINLGYANAKIFKSDDGIDSRPGSSKPQDGEKESAYVSFVDCPGHHQFMSIMVGGSAIFDAAIMVIAANEIHGDKFPSQTEEHLMVWDLVCSFRKTKTPTLIVLNKCDQVGEDDIAKKMEAIRKFVKGTCAEKAPIIPCSANFNWNIDPIRRWIVHASKMARHHSPEPGFATVRSFDVNKPGSSELAGAVVGGAVVGGEFNVGDQMVFLPGRVQKTEDGFVSHPYVTTVVSIKSDELLGVARPGGSVGIQTTLYPSLAKKNGLVGQYGVSPHAYPPVLDSVVLESTMLKRDVSSEKIKVSKNMTVHLQIMSKSVRGTIVQRKKLEEKKKKIHFTIKLLEPICAYPDTLVAISNDKSRLIGYGTILSGNEIPIVGMPPSDEESVVAMKMTAAAAAAAAASVQDQSDELSFNIDEYTLLNDIKECKRQISDTKKIAIPIPKIVIEGGGRKKYNWVNIVETLDAIDRKVQDLSKYIRNELGKRTSATYLEDRQALVLEGKIFDPRKVVNNVQALLQKYLKMRVMCLQCKSLHTTLNIKDGLTTLTCQTCRAERCV